MTITDTERLTLRRFDTGDAAFILALLNTPGWLRFIGDRKVYSLEDAEKYILNGPLKTYNTLGFGLYCACLKTDGTPVGMCGLVKRETLEHADIGFAFLPEHAGKGYALEAALAIVNYAQQVLKMPTLAAITLADNRSSIALLEKIGLRFQKMIVFPGDTEELMLFSIQL